MQIIKNSNIDFISNSKFTIFLSSALILASIFSLIINTRNANCFTGRQGYKGLEKIAEIASQKLTEKQKEDDEEPKKIKSKEIIFGCTGTIGENFPEDKIKSKIPELINKLKYTQNKLVWMKAALGIMTTDTQPKMAMEKCFIGNSEIKIFNTIGQEVYKSEKTKYNHRIDMQDLEVGIYLIQFNNSIKKLIKQ